MFYIFKLAYLNIHKFLTDLAIKINIKGVRKKYIGDILWVFEIIQSFFSVNLLLMQFTFHNCINVIRYKYLVGNRNSDKFNVQKCFSEIYLGLIYQEIALGYQP